MGDSTKEVVVDATTWGALEPLYRLLVQGHLATLILAAVILLIVGNYATTHQPRVRKVGLVIGGLAFVGFLVLLFDLSPQGFTDSFIESITRNVLFGLISMAIAWFLLTLLFALTHSLILGPIRSVTHSTQQHYENYRCRSDMAGMENENARLQRSLAEAFEKIATLEKRPNSVPDNVDAITLLTIAWSQERERVLHDNRDGRPGLDRLDAQYARKLADLLEQQEREHRGNKS